MNLESKTALCCISGTQAEFAGNHALAFEFYRQAWAAASTDPERCIAAHYLARSFDDPAARLHWNRAALEFAHMANDESTAAFYPSLYLNLGQSYEQTGDLNQAQHFYKLAADLGFPHDPDQPSP